MGSFGRKKTSPGKQRREDRVVSSTKPDDASPPKTSSSDPVSSAAVTGPDANSSSLQQITNETYLGVINTLDLNELRKLEQDEARDQVREAAASYLDNLDTTLAPDEREQVITDIINEALGYGPLEPLLAQDDITDIMVNGPNRVYVERKGQTRLSGVTFRSEDQLLNICKKIAQQVGRQVDEANPVCDARLPDGSRVNIVTRPLSLDGTTLTIRKFSEEKLTLEDLVRFGSINEAGAEILRIASQARCNILVSGGTGSGKTTLLNCLTGFIDDRERIITCEDAAELQLQQPHVVRLETRPPSREGVGEVTMRDLVKNCLRMRPDRIIVGEVRGPEALDLLNAMNTGHDGSMGTVHANAPRDALGRLETMIAMGGFELPEATVRQIIRSSVDVVVQAARLRDGSRRITSISEITGMEGGVISMQEIFRFDYEGEDTAGNVLGSQKPTGITPHFRENARYFGMAQRLDKAVHADAQEAA